MNTVTVAEAAPQPPAHHPELELGSQPGVVPGRGQLEFGEVKTDRGDVAMVHTSSHTGS
ncbi:MAG: hypothetical protein AAB391_01230 [Patescibacteria group bacterium]